MVAGTTDRARGTRCWGAAFAAAITAALALAQPAPAAPMTQLAAPNGCLTPGPVTGCTNTAGLAVPEAIVVRGTHAYVASSTGGRITTFDRDATTGALNDRDPGPTSCIADASPGGPTDCLDGRAIANPKRIVLSPDGTHLYVVSNASVAVLDRDPATGNLTQSAAKAACVSQDGSGGACNTSPPLGYADNIALSPDGHDAYVIGRRPDLTNGLVTLLDVVADGLVQHGVNAAGDGIVAGSGGCVEETVVTPNCLDGRALKTPYTVQASPDGAHVYVTAYGSSAVSGYTRGSEGQLGLIAGPNGCFAKLGQGEGCRESDRFGDEGSALLLASNRDVYIATRAGSLLLHAVRDATTGGLTFSSCVRAGTPGCGTVHDLFGATELALAPDGNNVFLAALFGRGLSHFSRALDGSLTTTPPPGGCLATGGSGFTTPCTIPTGFAHVSNQEYGPGSIAFSDDGRFVYTAAPGVIEDRPALLVASRPVDPICRDASVQVTAGQTATLPLDCSDADGDPVTIAITTPPATGTLGAIDQAARTVPYSAPAGFDDKVTLVFNATANGAEARPATVTIDVVPPPPPVVEPTPTPPPPQQPTPVPPVVTPPAVIERINSTVSTRWAVAKRFALLKRLIVNDLPAGAIVTVSCKGKRKGCPFKSRTFKRGRNGSANATKAFAKKRLKPGVVIEVRITKPGAIGRVLTYKLTARKVPKPVTQCLPVGSTKPARSC